MPIAQALSPADAGRLAARIRQLHRRGELTHADLAIADALLWGGVRKPGTGLATASYTTLCRLARVARASLASGLRRLERLGVIQRIKCRVRVGVFSRQGVNTYRLLAPATEFSERPVSKSFQIILSAEPSPHTVLQAQRALAEVRKRRMASIEALLRKGEKMNPEPRGAASVA